MIELERVASQSIGDVSPVMKNINLNRRLDEEQLNQISISDNLAKMLILQEPDSHIEIIENNMQPDMTKFEDTIEKSRQSMFCQHSVGLSETRNSLVATPNPFYHYQRR
jgi:hypothetical protein